MFDKNSFKDAENTNSLAKQMRDKICKSIQISIKNRKKSSGDITPRNVHTKLEKKLLNGFRDFAANRQTDGQTDGQTDRQTTDAKRSQ